MQILVLAAGYATRLYPLTLNQPKPLLKVGGKPMINHVLDCLTTIPEVDGIFVVTNAKFAGHFEDWAKEYGKAHEGIAIKVVNDGSTSDENKLGATGDIRLVIEKEKIKDDLIVVAGDNLFDHTLEGFGAFCKEKGEPVEAVYDVGDFELVKKYNSISVNEEGRIVFFEEKSPNPQSTLTGIALYYYPSKILSLFGKYLDDGNNPDQPGRFIQWLYAENPVYTWKVPGLWYDIGGKESLAEADRVFSEKVCS